MARYRDIANKRAQQIAASYDSSMGIGQWDRLSPQRKQEILRGDIKWRHAETQALAWEKDPKLSSQDFFEAAQIGPDLLASTTAGDPGPGYTGVGMDPKFQAQRRLLEDEEEMYQRSGIFRMTPYGWPQ
tara:strand:+ start:369 stop:755 length:387 start_codon:yes stop_codon:yes gene_type:complete